MDVFKTLILDTPDSLDNISGVLPVVNGGTGADNASDARDNLGLGTMATQDANAVAITGGSATGLTSLGVVDNTTLGSSNSDTVTFNARIASEFTPATDNTYDLGRTGHEWRDLYLDGTANIDSLIADTADINGGTIDAATIGATTPAAGTFSQVNSTGAIIATGAGSFGDDTDITGDLTVTGDAEINGLTVGRGSGNVNDNTALGYRSLYLNTTGGDNTALGYTALYSNTTGVKNTASGYVALYSNTDGVNNTASGYQALYTNTTGVNNTALGMGALLNNTTGNNNAASGYLAGYDNTEGVQNTYLGYNTGRGITTGNYNTVLGANVTGLSATLSNNVIIADGQGNRRINIDSSGNVGVGTATPEHKLSVFGDSNGNRTEVGIDNVDQRLVLGAYYEIGVGQYSTIQATNNLETAATSLILQPDGGNVGIGTSPSHPLHVYRSSSGTIAEFRSNDGTGNPRFSIYGDTDGTHLHHTWSSGAENLIFEVGGSAGSNEKMRITNGGNVGVGTSAPSAKLHVDYSVNASASTLAEVDDLSAARFGPFRADTDDNLYFLGIGGGKVGLQARDSTASGVAKVLSLNPFGGRVGIGTSTPAHKLTVVEASTDFAALINNVTSSGNGLKINAGSNSGDSILQLNDKDGNEKMRVLGTGNVGIGLAGPSYQLQLSTDSAAKPSTNTWTIASDARIKTETGEYTKGLDAVLSLRPITYRYNGKAGMVDDGEDKISIIAQEAVNAFPECVGSYMTKLDEDDEEETEVLNWNGHALTFALVNSIKELAARLEALENN